MKRFIMSVLIPAILLSGICLSAEESFSGYHQADTDHFTFVFDADGKEEAQRFAPYAETAWYKIARVYGKPQDKTVVFMTSNTDVINAFAIPESCYMGMYTTPNNIVDFGFRTNWHETFFTHELIHIANMNFEGRRSDSLSWFGTFFPLMDTSVLPGFALEGLTTVLETELTAGGRGRSPYWELKYKAPAMENNMVTYAQIGSEEIPPSGQIYVYGYLLTRAIADLYGLDTLASIERNRSLFGDWDEAVYTVTGETPENIFTAVKTALDKRYVKERTIPEGITVSPHQMGISCEPKPLFLDDGSFICMRSYWNGPSEIVLIDPAYQTEEVLISAWPQEFSAAENGTIIFTTYTDTAHKGTGVRSVTDLYIYSYETGETRQLTSGSSFFQPCISAKGNRLVACQLMNGRYRIVEVSLTDGSVTPLLESPDIDYIQPQLSASGMMLTCLEANDTRAAVAVCEMPGKNDPDRARDTYKVIYNDVPAGTAPSEIFDPAYPSFNGSYITFASNERGRLELYECKQDGSDCIPVLSDPVGVLWATTVGDTIFYSSYASTGYVIKAKPLSEWGVIPDFEGPSKPGEIITFGELMNDYPGFAPFAIPEPVYVKRPEEFTITPKTSAPSAVLSNERKYVDLPHLMLLVPNISSVEGPATWFYGFGFEALGMSHMKQNNSSLTISEASMLYYPDLNQFSGNILFAKQKGASEVIFDLGRRLTGNTGTYGMTESTTGILSYAFPLYVVSSYFGMHDTALILGSSIEAQRTASHPFAFYDDIDYRFSAQATVGIETSHRIGGDRSDMYVDFGASTTGTWQPDNNLTKLLYEADAGIYTETATNWTGFSLKGRWFDLPDKASIPTNITTLKISNIDCEYPGRLIADFSTGGYFDNWLVTVFLQKMVSFGKNSNSDVQTPDTGNFMNLAVDPITYIGLEAGLKQGRITASAGFVLPIGSLFADDWETGRFYLSVKANGFRMSFPGLQL